MTPRAYAGTIIALIAFATHLAAHAAIPGPERDTLVALYTDTNGASWIVNTNWNSAVGTECTWYGVTCDGSSSHVTGISLYLNNLTGTLPSLSALPALTTFVVGRSATAYYDCGVPNQNLIGGSLPAFSTGLTDLEAGCNQFTGSIPSLSGLTGLVTFDVGVNHLTGTIPSLNGLAHLNVFSVAVNQLTGTIPSLSQLTDLYSLNVYANHLTGTIPSLSGLTNVLALNFADNQLTGTIPPLNGLTNLMEFYVGFNHLTGALPAAPGAIFFAGLCPNDFPESSYVDNAAWDTATGVTPWYTPCNLIFWNGFELP